MESAWPAVLRDAALQDKIKACKVLAVGAGGIGCELLKTLVLTGFRSIEVIDLDTIETSNLNRQFLFRKHHVGSSKASVAAEVVRSFAPDAAITAHQANVKEGRFGVDYFGSFDLVLNGLDNMEARRHVNRLCIAAGTPLVESGTAGFLGQVTVHLKGSTECYECTAKPAPKAYPICTLRNTPDRPIHCVVWAKDLLFARLFGPPDAATDLDSAGAGDGGGGAAPAAAPAEGDSEAAGTSDAVVAEAEAAAAAAPAAAAWFERREGEAPLAYAARVFEGVFCTDVRRLAKHEELWSARPPPAPLVLSELLPDLAAVEAAAEAAAAAGGAAACAHRALGLKDQEVWSPESSAAVFLASVAAFLTARTPEVGAASFDKDDDLAVDLVASAANLRSACYGIPPQSRFAAKGMAGNIVHAIATTNAIVSGLIVVEALKVVAGVPERVTPTYLQETATTRGKRKPEALLIIPEVAQPPRPGCMVCGTAQLHLRINTATTTLGQLIDKVLKKRLSVNQPTLLAGGFMYEEGEGLEEDEVAAYAALLPRALRDLPGGGLGGGTLASVQDQSQGLSLELVITHQEDWDEEAFPEGFDLQGEAPAPVDEAAARPAAEAAGASAPSAPAAGGTHKRAREEDGGDAGGEGAAKRAKGGETVTINLLEEGNDDEDVVIV